ncbi:hypothetical protein CDAR_315121 [Caerostris darwini]|uniref:Uncharacterized protein n=1 Tax=Caerostris darwini TaxID=1538125 RepID=A0AAV4TUS6_9ARAC|nr:hypothetical protein CDAR_315121 [Caerostris darwini]
MIIFMKGLDNNSLGDSHETPTADRLNGFSSFEGPFYLVPGASVSDEMARYLSNSEVEGKPLPPDKWERICRLGLSETCSSTY